MIDAFKDVFPGFLGYLAVGILVAGLTWLFDRRWRPQNRRRRGGGLVVSERATRPRDLESPSTPQPSPTLYRNGYTGRKLPDGPHKAPKVIADAGGYEALNDSVQDFIGQHGFRPLTHDEWREASNAERKLPPGAIPINDAVASWLRNEGHAS